MATKFIPPINFGHVEEDLFRMGQPTPLNFPFLAKLHLKTIIYLAQDAPSQQFLNFVNDQSIQLIHLGNSVTINTPSSNKATTPIEETSPQQQQDEQKRKKSAMKELLAMQDVQTNYLGIISEELVIAALDIMLDRKHYPMAVMCNLGRHRTGTVVGCLRKLQNWNVTSILDEYRRYAGSKVRVQNEQFIELFDTDLVRIPQHAIKWL